MRLTVKEFAAMIRVHPSTIYKLIRKGEIKAEKVDGKLHISEAEFQRWKKSCEVPAKYPTDFERWTEAQVNTLHNFAKNHADLIYELRKQVASIEDYTKGKFDLISSSIVEIKKEFNSVWLKLYDLENELITLRLQVQALKKPNTGLLRRLWRWLW